MPWMSMRCLYDLQKSLFAREETPAEKMQSREDKNTILMIHNPD